MPSKESSSGQETPPGRLRQRLAWSMRACVRIIRKLTAQHRVLLCLSRACASSWLAHYLLTALMLIVYQQASRWVDQEPAHQGHSTHRSHS